MQVTGPRCVLGWGVCTEPSRIPAQSLPTMSHCHPQAEATDQPLSIRQCPGDRADSLEKTLMLGKIEDKRRRGQQKMRWTWTWANSGRWWGTGRPGMLQSMGVAKSQTWLSHWTTPAPLEMVLNLISSQKDEAKYCARNITIPLANVFQLSLLIITTSWSWYYYYQIYFIHAAKALQPGLTGL